MREIDGDAKARCGLALQLEMRTIVSETVARELVASRAASSSIELRLEDVSPTKQEFPSSIRDGSPKTAPTGWR